jgi:hypothetical protein
VGVVVVVVVLVEVEGAVVVEVEVDIVDDVEAEVLSFEPPSLKEVKLVLETLLLMVEETFKIPGVVWLFCSWEDVAVAVVDSAPTPLWDGSSLWMSDVLPVTYTATEVFEVLPSACAPSSAFAACVGRAASWIAAASDGSSSLNIILPPVPSAMVLAAVFASLVVEAAAFKALYIVTQF